MNKKRSLWITAAAGLFFGFQAHAQEGRVTIEQNELIPQLLEKKSEMTEDGRLDDRYRIQLFSGDNAKASEIIQEFRSRYPELPSTLVYETPNYKVWVGSFRSSLEADQVLLKLKEAYPAAFRLWPDRK